jgi:hypothetical protein
LSQILPFIDVCCYINTGVVTSTRASASWGHGDMGAGQLTIGADGDGKMVEALEGITKFLHVMCRSRDPGRFFPLIPWANWWGTWEQGSSPLEQMEMGRWGWALPCFSQFSHQLAQLRAGKGKLEALEGITKFLHVMCRSRDPGRFFPLRDGPCLVSLNSPTNWPRGLGEKTSPGLYSDT